MTQFVKFTHRLVLVLIGILITLQGQNSLTQGNVTVLCDADFDLSQTSVPAAFPGVFYSQLTGTRENNTPYRFERIDGSGRTMIEAPFAPPQTSVTSPIVSPNNRFVAFRPYEGTNLTVWDMTTGEVVTTNLMPEELALVDGQDRRENYERHLSRMIWRDDSHLLLRGFPENQHDKEFTTTLEITVNASPLTLSKGTLTNVNYPALPPPPNMISEQVFLSPQGTYAVQLATVPVQGFHPQQYLRVFNVNTLQVVAELMPSRIFHAYGPPTWSQTEDRLFIGTRSEEIDNFQSEFAEVNLSTGQVNTALWIALENAVGANIETLPLRAVFSPDGNHFAFGIYGADQNQSYMVIYHLSTGNITAICDQYQISNSGALHTFWSPDGQYVGYWASGNVFIFNIQTGDTHLLSDNSVNFVGWVTSQQTATPTPPAPTLTPTPTSVPPATLTPNSTLTPTPPAAPTFTPTLAPSTLITDISVANGKAYTRDSVSMNNTLYIDRTYTFVTVPAQFLGQDYIRTANADKTLTTANFLTFTLTADARVYVAFDTRYLRPAWLATWTASGQQIVATEQGGTTLARQLFYRDFPAGPVTLPGNASPNASVMYTVIAVPNTLPATPTPAPTATATLTPTATAGVGCGALVQEAEAGTRTGNFVVGTDAAASGGQYLHVPNGTGSNYIFGNSNSATYCFGVSTPGTYRLKGWVYAATSSDDSFFVRFGGTDNTWNIALGASYKVDYVSHTGGADPVQVVLAAGDHTVIVYLREDGARLDKLELELVSAGATPTPAPTITPTTPVNATATPTPTSTPIHRIDAGGNGGTFSGVTWSADSFATGGRVPGTYSGAIAGTADDGLYQTERSANDANPSFSYDFPLANGTYEVRLHFAETWFVGGSRGAPGTNKRRFHVDLEGARVLDNYDITADVGHSTAVVKTFTATVTDGTLNVVFSRGAADNPSLAAIEVWTLGVP